MSAGRFCLSEYPGRDHLLPISHTHFVQRLEWELNDAGFKRSGDGPALASDIERLRALIDVDPPGGVVFAISRDDLLWGQPRGAAGIMDVTPVLDATGERSDLTVATFLPALPASHMHRLEVEWGVALYAVPSTLWHDRMEPDSSYAAATDQRQLLRVDLYIDFSIG